MTPSDKRASDLERITMNEKITKAVEQLQPYFASRAELEKMAADYMAQADERETVNNDLAELRKTVAELRATGVTATDPSKDKAEFSITRAIRGDMARKGYVINEATKEQDINYASKALTTGSTPGSYIVPTIHSDQIIEILGRGGVLRQMGPTIWPMSTIQKLNIPVEAAEPTVEYMAQNAEQASSDANFDQVNLDLKTRRSLSALPNELLMVSVPRVDEIVTRLIGKGLAKHEDRSFFTGGLSGGPTGVNQASGLSVVPQAGTSLAYVDLLNVLGKSADVEAEGPFVWAWNAGDFFRLVLNITDNQGRPIVQALAADNGVQFRLFGEQVFLTPRIPSDLGAGSDESYALRTNPSYIHLGDSGAIEIAVSGERFFDKYQTAIRGVHRHDFGYSPKAGIVKLTGVK
jgi:HK97 family phage major capsid protein